MPKWSVQFNVLLNNCKQNIKSLSLFVGTTVVHFIMLPSDVVYLFLTMGEPELLLLFLKLRVRAVLNIEYVSPPSAFGPTINIKIQLNKI